MSNMYPAYMSISVRDAYIADPTLFDECVLNTEERTNRFKEMFLAQWGIYSIGSETIPMFKVWVTNTFKLHYKQYEELLDWQETQIEMLSGGSYEDNTTYIDLPNRSTQGEYPTSKEKRSVTRTEPSIERKLLYKETIQNIMLDFVMEFKTCMCLVYY